MAYQIAKEIGSASAVLNGKVDAIVLTGGLAYGKGFRQGHLKRINWIADVIIQPGENELQALAEGALDESSKMKKTTKIYPGTCKK